MVRDVRMSKARAVFGVSRAASGCYRCSFRNADGRWRLRSSAIITAAPRRVPPAGGWDGVRSLARGRRVTAPTDGAAAAGYDDTSRHGRGRYRVMIIKTTAAKQYEFSFSFLFFPAQGHDPSSHKRRLEPCSSDPEVWSTLHRWIGFGFRGRTALPLKITNDIIVESITSLSTKRNSSAVIFQQINY